MSGAEIFLFAASVGRWDTYEDCPLVVCEYADYEIVGRKIYSRKDQSFVCLFDTHDGEGNHRYLPEQRLPEVRKLKQYACLERTFDYVYDKHATLPAVKRHHRTLEAIRKGYTTNVTKDACAIIQLLQVTKRKFAKSDEWLERMESAFRVASGRKELVVVELKLEGATVGAQSLWISDSLTIMTHRIVRDEHLSATRLLYASAVEESPNAKINDGGSYGNAGLHAFKMEMKPRHIQTYFRNTDNEQEPEA